MAGFRYRWHRVSIRYKVMVWVAAVSVIIMQLVVLSSAMQEDVLDAYTTLMDDNVTCYQFQEAIEQERNAFLSYIREVSGENWDKYQTACAATRQAIDDLPFDYTLIGQERYARTWNIRNGYEGYTAYRDAVITQDQTAPDFAGRLYEVMEMQESLSDYALRLVQLTLEEGNEVYSARARLIRLLPLLHVMLALMAAGTVLMVIRMLSRWVVRPMLRMEAQTRQFQKGDFSGDDIPLSSGDEIGRLVSAFNQMKHTLRDHIKTLEEKNRMAEALHQQKLAKLELEKNLDHTRLEMLKSQVNPHFLFNTLNMISCMAKLEDADTTDQMILSLSSLFRYNLRTQAQEVSLAQELDALDDYIYIQQMRFESRITFRKIIRADADRVRIPSFTLQPVVENAIIHGLGKMEAGGRITLRIWEEEDHVVVSVADNGRGMTERELEILRQKLRSSQQTGRGIGLGNICRRIDMLYPEGSYHIYSKPEVGTIIRFVIPQNLEEEA